MNSCTCSMLRPTTDILFYSQFYSEYSSFIAGNLIATKLISTCDNDSLHDFLNELDGQYFDYQRTRALQLGMGVEFSCQQLEEDRGFQLSKLLKEAMNNEGKVVDLLCGYFDIQELITVHALYENAIKTYLGKGFKLAKMMEQLCLHLEREDKKDSFIDLLTQRTPLSGEQGLLEMWSYFHEIRNLYAHAGGLVTANWRNGFNGAKADYIITAIDPDQLLLRCRLGELSEELGPIVGEFLVVPKGLVNVFRNYIIGVLETLYLLEIQE